MLPSNLAYEDPDIGADLLTFWVHSCSYTLVSKASMQALSRVHFLVMKNSLISSKEKVESLFIQNALK